MLYGPASKGIRFMAVLTVLGGCVISCYAESAAAGPYPTRDTKSVFTFKAVSSLDEWNAYRKCIREHVLVSAGLWPMLAREDLKPVRFDAKAFDGFIREKIYFWSLPGVLVTGALYTPSSAPGKSPAVLCPHGHWAKGRLDEPPQARFINLAKQGYIVLAIDMVGYNDNGPLPHSFPGDPLWGLSLGGLQLWNCIRSMDLLESLDNVDPKRIGVTGASGGGTQTFMLCAVDDRPVVAAPVCMISAHFQGGCLCENSPLMRIFMNNMEIGAAMAPRPLVMVSATGDWTKDTPKIEYPAIRRVYELMGATDRIAEQQFNLGHNYDRVSREVVYAWFARWLKNAPPDTNVAELPYQIDPDLRLFSDARPRPQDAKSSDEVIRWWRQMAQAQLDGLRPKDAETQSRFRTCLGTALRHTLCNEPCGPDQLILEPEKKQAGDGISPGALRLGLKGRGTWVTAMLSAPESAGDIKRCFLIVHPEGTRGVSPSLIRSLVEAKSAVLTLDPLGLGQRRPTDDKFYYTYNRSNLAIRVQEILLGISALSHVKKDARIDVIGLDQAGLWTLLARAVSETPNLGAALIDGGRFDGTSSAWQNNEMFSPGILRVGGTDTAGGLIAPAPLTIHNAGGKLGTETTRAAYRATGAESTLRIVDDAWSEQAIADWAKQP